MDKYQEDCFYFMLISELSLLYHRFFYSSCCKKSSTAFKLHLVLHQWEDFLTPDELMTPYNNALNLIQVKCVISHVITKWVVGPSGALLSYLHFYVSRCGYSRPTGRSPWTVFNHSYSLTLFLFNLVLNHIMTPFSTFWMYQIYYVSLPRRQCCVNV